VEADRAKKFQILVGLVVLIMVLAAEPQITLFVLAAAYVFSGPLMKGYRLVKKGRNPAGEEEKKSV
jgi:CDP-diacylglycerol--serine O-phosphatidyltransferase